MLRSLFSGVTGLQAHQIAMDVESNNIANVNTIGYKYSRANFSDLLAQTSQIATAPQGQLGGKNAVQVGLGTSVSSITRIMTQGSIQNTDKNTDVAIQGDGFFIVSSDGGSTYKYTRSGDFKFDAQGNFVDNNGFIVQGWLRNEETGKVDSTAPITNIQIKPGLTTPANATTDVVLKANLDSGDTVETFNVTTPLDTYNLFNYQSYIAWQAGTGPAPATPAEQSAWTTAYNMRTDNAAAAENMSVMFNDQGQSYALQQNQGVWISYRDSIISRGITASAGSNTISINGTSLSYNTLGNSSAEDATIIAQAINGKTAQTGVVATVTTDAAGNATLTLTNDNARESDVAETKNIIIQGTLGGVVDNTGDKYFRTAYQYQYATSATDITSYVPNASSNTFTTTEQLRLLMESHARYVAGTAPQGIPQISEYNFTNGTINTGDTLTVTLNDGTTTFTGTYTPVLATDTVDTALNALAADLRTQLGATYTVGYDTINNTIRVTGPNATTTFTTAITSSGSGTLTGTTNDTVQAANTTPNYADGITVIINDRGQYQIQNQDDGDGGTIGEDLKLQITAFKDAANNIIKNNRFSESIQSLNGVLLEGSSGLRLSQGFNAATHAASIDIYDSLGSKHTLTMEFRKVSFDKTAGSTWEMKLSVPTPGEINTVAPLNEFIGQVNFGPDGALSSYTPTNVNFTGNNGSAPNQNVQINLGTSNAFDGITSFDATSGTSGISQDGFPGGDLVGIRIDQSGTLVGSFSNGRSFGLAQIGMAKFTNNEGLVTDGGNVYLQSANSGDPIIGTAATAGRGFMQSSALEASNVDLSKSLTNLIIIQRGYQANGKTITTSDTLLETLIGLKR